MFSVDLNYSWYKCHGSKTVYTFGRPFTPSDYQKNVYESIKSKLSKINEDLKNSLPKRPEFVLPKQYLAYLNY